MPHRDTMIYYRGLYFVCVTAKSIAAVTKLAVPDPGGGMARGDI